MNQKIKIFFVAFFFFIGGCANQNAYINSLISNDANIYTGCSGLHIRGKDAQKKLAIQRAIDLIALEKQTTVTMDRTNQTLYSSGKKRYSNVKINSKHTSNITVKTKILKIYNNNNNEICAEVMEK